jgi:hypothetical protein
MAMKITKTNPMTGKNVTLEVPITPEEYQEIQNRFITGKYIQDIVPDLKDSYREFLISGIDPDSWEEYVAAHSGLDDLYCPEGDD